jgi:hypothetical protein
MEDVERYFHELPANLAELVAPVRGVVGAIDEYFLADDERLPPVLDYHEWLLADLRGAEAEADALLRKQLFVCGYFWLAAINGVHLLLHPTPGILPRHLLAVTLLQHAAQQRLAALLPVGPAWEYLGTALWDAASASVARCAADSGGGGAGPTAPIWNAGRQWAPLVSLSLTVLHHARREELLPEVVPLIHRMNAAWQVYGDMLNLRHDAEHGVVSFAIERLRQEAGLPADAAPDQVLAALLTTGCAEAMLDDALALAHGITRDTEQLSLPSTTAHCAQLTNALDDLRQALRCARSSLASALRSSPAPARGRASAMENAIARAQDYLLDDIEMREAWDVYRTGFLGEAVRVGRPFPVGFALENLAATGIDVRQPIVATLRVYGANRGDYFDGSSRLAREIDTLGLMLRLASRVELDGPLREMLVTPLRWVEERLDRDGTMPVWVMDTAPPEGQSVLFGMHCVTCQTNLLLGLAVQPCAQFDAVLERGLQHVIAIVAASGVGRTAFYSPRYLLWMLHELVLALSRLPAARLPDGAAALQPCVDALRGHKGLHTVSTPQQAALAVLSGVAASGDGALCRSCAETMLRAQRPDGGWSGEALYWAPTQQSPGYWYSSRTATTSLCHRALVALRDFPEKSDHGGVYQ